MPHCSMRLASRRSLACTRGNSRCIAKARLCLERTDKGRKVFSKLIARHVFQIGELARGANLFRICSMELRALLRPSLQ
jgi:hypothetical protein